MNQNNQVPATAEILFESEMDLVAEYARANLRRMSKKVSNSCRSGESDTTMQYVDANNIPHYFLKEIRLLMYAFGEDASCYEETLNLLEQIVVHYIINITETALKINGSGKVTVDDIRSVFKNDSMKYARINELLYLSTEVKKAKKVLDDSTKDDI